MFHRGRPRRFSAHLVSLVALHVGLASPGAALSQDSARVPAAMGAASAKSWLAGCNVSNGLLLQSGFGSSSVRAGGGQVEFLEGTAEALPCPAVATRPPGVAAGLTRIEYQGGNRDERAADVVADPLKPDNRVLQFRLNSANVRDERGAPEKARVQMDLYGNKGVREVRSSMRIFLAEGFDAVSDFRAKNEWMTISEWWNNANWTGEQYPFRISVNLVKDKAGSGVPLVFGVHAQAFDRVSGRWSRKVWSAMKSDFPIPLGKWLTLHYYWLEGDAAQGRFMLTVQPDSEASTVVFDITNFTHHPDDPSPDGLTHYNPIKIYTSKDIMAEVQSRGKSLRVLWDDLEIRLCGTVPVVVANASACKAP